MERGCVRQRPVATLRGVLLSSGALAVEWLCTIPRFNRTRLGPHTLIATSCIEKGLALLYSDKDFAPFVEHLGFNDTGSVHYKTCLTETFTFVCMGS